VLGLAGAVLGSVTGSLIGTAGGFILIIPTLGFSLPVGAIVGGSTGLCISAIACGTAGSAACGIGAYSVLTYNLEMNNGVVRVHSKVRDASEKVKKAAVVARNKASSFAERRKIRSRDLSNAAHSIAMDPKIQVAMATAAGSAVVLGTAGGATGAIAGGTVGAAVGLVPAVFTFGLSIPAGAAIGCNLGLAAGAVIAGSVGFFGGGAVGYHGYSCRNQIRGSASTWMGRVIDCSNTAKSKACGSANSVAALLGRGCTGSTV